MFVNVSRYLSIPGPTERPEFSVTQATTSGHSWQETLITVHRSKLPRSAITMNLWRSIICHLRIALGSHRSHLRRFLISCRDEAPQVGWNQPNLYNSLNRFLRETVYRESGSPGEWHQYLRPPFPRVDRPALEFATIGMLTHIQLQ